MLKDAAKVFLKLNTVAVVGVSSKGDAAANIIYKNLKKHQYTVYPVNPNSEIVEGDSCYPSIASLPETPDWVVIATHPDVTPLIVNECIEQNITKIWIHKSLGNGSYNPEAIKKAVEAGLFIIPGSCPMMFLEPVDPAHACMKWFFKISGKEAEPVGFMR